MNQLWMKLSDDDKKRVFEQTATRKGINVQAVEKDWWVTTVLEALFSLPYAEHLSFKGGTSLSKCWEVIQRFSEDIDIAIDREFLGFTGKLSKTQISDKLRRAACGFVRATLKEDLEKRLLSMGLIPELFIVIVNATPVSTTDPETIEIHYNSLFTKGNYLSARVLIEVSGRSMAEPIETSKVNNLISEVFPSAPFTDTSFEVRAVSPKRTFLEKAFLLHEEFCKPVDEVRTNRMSRHLYDLEKLMDTTIAEKALSDQELYDSIIEHRSTFIGLKGFDYNTLNRETIRFVPPPEISEIWEKDYTAMQTSMIYGESLPYSDLLARIADLNNMFNANSHVVEDI